MKLKIGYPKSMKLIKMLELINITYLSIFNGWQVLSGCLNAVKTGNAGLKRIICVKRWTGKRKIPKILELS